MRRALKLTTLSLVWAIRCKFQNFNSSELKKVRAKLTRIKSWMRFDSPRLASTKSLVTGPGMPSVYPSPFPTSVSAPLCDSSVCSVPLLPLTSWNGRHNLWQLVQLIELSSIGWRKALKRGATTREPKLRLRVYRDIGSGHNFTKKMFTRLKSPLRADLSWTSSLDATSVSELKFLMAESKDSVPATTRNTLPAPRATLSAVCWIFYNEILVNDLFKHIDMKDEVKGDQMKQFQNLNLLWLANVADTIYFGYKWWKMEFNEKHSVCLIITKHNGYFKSVILTRMMSNKKFPEPPAPPEWSPPPDAEPPKFKNLFGFTIN